eukprot:3206442-Amphidinium_carterae.2
MIHDGLAVLEHHLETQLRPVVVWMSRSTVVIWYAWFHIVPMCITDITRHNSMPSRTCNGCSTPASCRHAPPRGHAV